MFRVAGVSDGVDLEGKLSCTAMPKEAAEQLPWSLCRPYANGLFLGM